MSDRRSRLTVFHARTHGSWHSDVFLVRRVVKGGGCRSAFRSPSNDFLERAELVYGERIGVVDEPDQPAASWGSLDLARGRRPAPGRRPPGSTRSASGTGERVAIVSHNSARLFTAFFGVSGSGRVLVPINFRLNAEEIAYIVEHSGASVLLVDPELDDALGAASTRSTGSCSAPRPTTSSIAFGVEPEPWLDPDEDATATINYTSGTTARPKGVQLTHRNIWINATTFGWQTGVNDRDVYLHTLPMFHCNGWGMPYAVTGMGGRHVVLRKVDGAEILRRVERPRRHAAVRRARGRRRGARRRAGVGRRDPRARARRASSSPARRRRRAPSSGSRPSSAGSSSRSTASPRRRRCSR